MISLHTTAVIAILNEKESRVNRRFESALRNGEQVAVSSVVLHELYFGSSKSQFRKRSTDRIREFVAGAVQTLFFDARDAEEAGDIRATLAQAGTPIGPYDILIAGQARCRNALLITANTREFVRVAGLQVQDWTR